MTSVKPSVVVVMGSFQLPWHYRHLKEELEKTGYKTTVINPPSTIIDGTTPLPDSLTADVEFVPKAITDEIESGRDVVVVAHSQGGQAASIASDGLGKEGAESGVVHMVFISAWLVEAGISGKDQPANGGSLQDGLQIIKSSAKPILYNDVPDALAEEAASFIYPKVANVTEAVTPSVCWNDVPSTYVVCENDCALLPAVQEWVISSCQLPSEILRIDSGHSPFLSLPETVAGIVRRAAGEEGVDMNRVKVDLKKAGSSE